MHPWYWTVFGSPSWPWSRNELCLDADTPNEGSGGAWRLPEPPPYLVISVARCLVNRPKLVTVVACTNVFVFGEMVWIKSPCST